MAIPQPTTSTTDQDNGSQVEQETETTDQVEEVEQVEPIEVDPAEKLVQVLNAATEATDPTTGTVPVMHVSLIVEALRQLRGNAKGETIARWSAEAFTVGVASQGWSIQQVGAVLTVVANPPTVAKPSEAQPEHEKLANALAILNRAREITYGNFDLETVERAQALINDPSFTLPEELVSRAQQVAKEAAKGRRGTGPKVDWAEAIMEALSDRGEPLSMVEVKAWARDNMGASQGGAIDRRHAGLLEANASTTGKDGELWAAGVRARFSSTGTPEFYLVDQV
jgi:hypothetical protein